MKIHHASASYLHAACREFPSVREPDTPIHRNSSTVNTMEGDMKMPAQSPPSPAQPETDSTGNSIDANVASNTAASLSYDTTVSHRGNMETTEQTSSSFEELDPAAIAAIRSTLLAENPALGQMHERLVLKTKKN
jgi:hypothetical protein